MSPRLRSFLLGAAVGAGLATAVFLAFDAGEARQGAAGPPALPAEAVPAAQPAAAARDAVPEHEAGAPPLPPEVEAQRRAYEARLAEQPDDLVARKRLALMLLSYARWVPAFEHATQILAARPDDPDGLYVQGEVRLAMGRFEESIALLDRVLAQYPDHVLALTAKGRAQYLAGARGEAVATWEAGLAAAGGRNGRLEQLLAEARGGPGVPTAEDLKTLVSH